VALDILEDILGLRYFSWLSDLSVSSQSVPTTKISQKSVFHYKTKCCKNPMEEKRNKIKLLLFKKCDLDSWSFISV
jgi:hypothetical protein